MLVKNLLLSTIPAKEYDILAARLKEVSFHLGEVLFQPGDKIEHVYFPTDCIVSLLTDLEDGSGLEVGLVGPEGIVGVSAFLGGTETKVATIQASGKALAMRASELRETFRQGGYLQKQLLRYTHALMTQISQSVVCNVRHPVEGRMARWLLMYHDRLGVNEFEMTQEFMSDMLGVRRSSVTEVALKLQERSLIRYQRGRITILDRQGLQLFACECYAVGQEKFEDFLRDESDRKDISSGNSKSAASP
jgi:CRP-like cAMP-binding protein